MAKSRLATAKIRETQGFSNLLPNPAYEISSFVNK
jgi:hypothetical protein